MLDNIRESNLQRLRVVYLLTFRVMDNLLATNVDNDLLKKPDTVGGDVVFRDVLSSMISSKLRKKLNIQ